MHLSCKNQTITKKTPSRIKSWQPDESLYRFRAKNNSGRYNLLGQTLGLGSYVEFLESVRRAHLTDGETGSGNEVTFPRSHIKWMALNHLEEALQRCRLAG